MPMFGVHGWNRVDATTGDDILDQIHAGVWPNCRSIPEDDS